MKALRKKFKIYLSKLIYYPFTDWENIEVYFIISTGRTATKFLAKYFQSVSGDCYSVHEPQPDLLQICLDYSRGKISAQKARKKILFHRGLINKIIRNNKTRFYIESNNNIVPAIDLIKTVFPKLKFLVVTRDPKTYVISAFNKVHGTSDHPYSIFSKQDPRDRLMKKDQLAWKENTRFEKICWHWMKYNELILEHTDSTSSLFIKYEDLFSKEDQDQCLEQLSTFFDFISYDELTKGDLNTRSNQSFNQELKTYNEWSDDMKNSFHRIVDQTSQKLGYN